MSLINDALKKAQRQRGDTTSPVPSPTSAAPMPGPLSAAPSRRPSSNSRPQALLIGAGAAFGLLLSAIAFFLFRSPAAEPIAANSVAPAASPAPASAPAVASTTSTPSPAETPAASPTNVPAVKNPPAPQAEPIFTVTTTPAPAVETKREIVVATPSGTPPRPSLEMIKAVESFRIAGVRASGADSKVLMNDRVYRVGDVVDHALGIRVSAVAAGSVSFVDESGATYARNF